MLAIKCQLQILKNESIVSTDADLQGIISDLTTSMKARSIASTIDENISLAMMHTLVYAGEALLANKSMLLPSIHNLLLEKFKKLLAMCNRSLDEPLVSAHWVLSNLIATYKHHLSNICKRKHGTIIIVSNRL